MSIKSIGYFVLPALILFLISGCKKEDQPDPVIPQGTQFNIGVEIVSGSQLVQPGSTVYTSESGAQFKADLIKFFLSNFSFIKSDGSEYKAGSYSLVDYSDEETRSIRFGNIPSGTYTGIKCLMGIDSTANHTLVSNEPDLDPITGMIWSWSSGYIFYKHEGAYIDANGNEQALVYHYGQDKAVVYLEFQFSNAIEITDKTELNAKLILDLAKVYSTPNVIDFETYNNNQSLTPADNSWIELLKANFAQSFRLEIQ
jgi:hypothetical protein